MRVEDLLIFGKKYCHSDHVKILLADLLELNPLELLNYLEDIVEEEKCKKFEEMILSLNSGKPLQYVIGSVNFYGNRFLINENVLIPRFETEELVENTCTYIEQNFPEQVKILDIGCGSGVIGLTIKKRFPNAEVDLLDISETALEVAKENAKRLHLNVGFIQSDTFEHVNKKYDVIISNPPYIKIDEEIENIVKEIEPHIALYAGLDGLDIYKKILENISIYLNHKFLIAFEIGCTQKNDIITLVHTYLQEVEIQTKKDLSGRDRMLFILGQKTI